MGTKPNLEAKLSVLVEVWGYYRFRIAVEAKQVQLQCQAAFSRQKSMILGLDETGSCWEPLKPSKEGVHTFTSGSCVLILSSKGNRF